MHRASQSRHFQAMQKRKSFQDGNVISVHIGDDWKAGMPPHIFRFALKFYAHMAINWHMAAERIHARATQEMNEQTTCFRDIVTLPQWQHHKEIMYYVQHLQPSNASASSKHRIEQPLILCWSLPLCLSMMEPQV